MKVRMRTNLGSNDAGKFGVDFRKFTDGAEVSANDDLAEWLIATGKADVIEKPVKETIKAVPPETVKAVPTDTIKAK